MTQQYKVQYPKCEGVVLTWFIYNPNDDIVPDWIAEVVSPLTETDIIHKCTCLSRLG